MRVRLVIPIKPPGKNDLRPDPRVTRMGQSILPSAYLRWKGYERKWRRALDDLAPREDQRASGRRSLRFTRVMSAHEKRMDRWNLEGGLNLVVVDMLVQLGWLLDDAEDCVEMLPAEQRRAWLNEVAPATWIEIEDLPAAALVAARLPGL